MIISKFIKKKTSALLSNSEVKGKLFLHLQYHPFQSSVQSPVKDGSAQMMTQSTSIVSQSIIFNITQRIMYFRPASKRAARPECKQVLSL